MKTHDTHGCCMILMILIVCQMISIQQSTIYSKPDSVFEDIMFGVVECR